MTKLIDEQDDMQTTGKIKLNAYAAANSSASTLAAAEAFATAADTVVLSTAEAFATSAASTAQTGAETFATSADATVLASAEAYTDSHGGATTFHALTDIVDDPTNHNIVVNNASPVTEGTGNTAFGDLSGTGNGGGSNFNASFGFEALHSGTTGTHNNAFGAGALQTSGALSGSDNSGLGANAGGSITSGNQNTCVGNQADVTTGSDSNTFALGYQAVAPASNTGQMGNPSVTDVYLGTPATTRIHANGSQLSGMAAIVVTVTTPTVVDGTQYLQFIVGGVTHNVAIVTPGT